MEKIDKVVYYKLTTLLLKVKFFTYIINILFYIYLNDSEAIGGLLFNIVLLILFYLLRDKYFNLIRVLVCINEFIVVLIGFFILSLVHKNLMPLSVYIIIIIEILSQIFIPIIIFNYKSEKKYIIPIFLFYILLFLFIDDYIYLTTGTKIITLIHNSLTSFQWKITILFPFLGFLATILVFIRQIHYNEMIVKKYNEDLQATLEELRTTQQHMIQTEKMASLGTLTSGVAHEINNPLNFIQSGVIGLEHYLKENNPEMDGRVTLFMDAIQTGISRVSSIVKGLNQFSRSTDFNMEVCDIHTIIDNSLIILQNNFRNKIDIYKSYTMDSFIIKGNVGKLHQVFLNIFTNSFHAIKDKGSISISTRIESTRLKIEILDTGSGINADILSKIMDPFFTTKDAGQGTGLGLYITYTIIKEHQGEFIIESEIEKGTKAIITLPISKSE